MCPGSLTFSFALTHHTQAVPPCQHLFPTSHCISDAVIHWIICQTARYLRISCSQQVCCQVFDRGFHHLSSALGICAFKILYVSFTLSFPLFLKWTELVPRSWPSRGSSSKPASWKDHVLYGLTSRKKQLLSNLYTLLSLVCLSFTAMIFHMYVFF